MKSIGIIIPCYNEEDVIEVTNTELCNIAIKIKDKFNYSTELYYVDDGSNDRTSEKLKNICKNNIIKTNIFILSRNFGQSAALTAALDCALNDAVILIDADLQDPPYFIIDMIKEWDKGFHMVHARRSSRKGETFLKKLSAKVAYKTINFFADINLPANVGDFRLMDKQIVMVLRKLPEKSRYLRGLSNWVGFSSKIIEYSRDARVAGTTKYNYRNLISLALLGITSFSNKPLRLSFFLSIFILICCMLLFIYILGSWINGITIPGWTSLALIILFMGGIQLFMISIISEYIAQIFLESKNRPTYITKDTFSNDI